MWYHAASGKIDPSDHLDAADAPPMFFQRVEQAFGILPDGKRPQQEQPRPAIGDGAGASKPSEACACDDLVGSECREGGKAPRRMREHESKRVCHGEEKPDRVECHRLIARELCLVAAAKPRQRQPAEEGKKYETDRDEADERSHCAESH